MVNSSFFTDGGVYETAVVTPHDNAADTTPSQAPSGFYPDGQQYAQADVEASDAARDEAVAAAAAALASQGAAATSAAAAAVSKTGSDTAAAAALASQNAASTSATNAATSETNALASKNAAATSASNASTSEGNALTYKNAAGTSATNAATSEGNAATSASNAAGSASAASTSASNAAAAVQAAAGTATPLVAGTAAVGTGVKWSREDHKHPVDTATPDARIANAAGTATPTGPGTAAVGTSAKWAHEDHVHPKDSTKADLASPTFTGVPAVPTAAPGTSTTQAASTAFVTTALSSAGAVLRGYLAGYTLTWNTAGTLLVTAGQCSDSTNTALLTRSSSVVKSTAAWAAGAAGGLDTGTIAANTWYHWYVIYNPTTPATDVIFSTSASGPALPSGYTLSRRIGATRTNASAQWTKFVQDGDTFMWDAPVADVSATNPGTAAVLRTMSLPLGLRVKALLSVVGQATAVGSDGLIAIYVSDPSLSDIAAHVANGTVSQEVYFVSAGGGSTALGGQVWCYTNTSAQVRTRVQQSTAGSTLSMSTLGWIDTRGKDA